MSDTTKKRITVQVGSLTKPLATYRVTQGITLVAFLEARSLSYGAGVRVNGKPTKREARLRQGDIITITQAVNGGAF